MVGKTVLDKGTLGSFKLNPWYDMMYSSTEDLDLCHQVVDQHGTAEVLSF